MVQIHNCYMQNTNILKFLNILKDILSEISSIIYILVKYLILFSGTFFIFMSISFVISPVFTKFVLNYMLNVDLNALNLFESQEILERKIQILSEKINSLEMYNKELESNLAKVKAEKEGIMSGFNNVKIEHNNSKALTLILVAGSCFLLYLGYNFMFSGGNDFSGYFNSIASHISKENALTLKSLAEKHFILDNKIVTVSKQVQDTECTVNLINNFIGDNHFRWRKN